MQKKYLNSFVLEQWCYSYGWNWAVLTLGIRHSVSHEGLPPQNAWNPMLIFTIKAIQVHLEM